MKWKTTLFLLAATIGLGAYVSLYELKQPTEEERQRQSHFILDLNTGSVTQIALDLPQAKTTLTRQESLWKLGPNYVRADSNVISQILTQVSPLTAERALTPSSKEPLELKAFGLDPALGSISFTLNNSTTTLMIGEATPVGNSRYVKLPARPDIFIVSAGFFASLDKPLDSFRDHALARISAQLCKDIELKSAGSSWHAVNENDSWLIKEPYSDKADPAEINGLIAQLSRLNARKFIRDASAPEELAQWGLGPAKATLSVQAGQPLAATTLLFGNPLPDDASLVYAKRGDEEPIVAVSADEVKAILKGASQIRSKQCFTFSPDKAEKIAVSWEGKNWGIEKNAEGKWIQTGPGTVLDEGRVLELISSFTQMQATGFVEGAPDDLKQYGLIKPAGTLSVTLSGPPATQVLAVGSPLPASEERYGTLPGRSGIAKLPAPVIATISQLTPEQLMQPALADKPDGPEHPLNNGGVDKDRKRGQRPPK